MVKEEATQGVNGPVVIIEPVVLATLAETRRTHLKSTYTLHGSKRTSNQPCSLIAAKTASCYAVERPGENVILFDIGGIFMVQAVKG